MLVECVCIVLIICLMAILFLRAHRKEYALTTIPLLILPLLHIFGLWLSHPLAKSVPLDPDGVVIAIDALALVISCTALGFFSHQIAARKPRIVYMICCCGFVTVLTWVLICGVLGR